MDANEISKDNYALREKVKDSSSLLLEIKNFLETEPDDELMRETIIKKINAWHGQGVQNVSEINNEPLPQ